MITKSVVVQLEAGPEARSIAKLVQVANKYQSSIYLNNIQGSVNAKSIMGMMTLGLASGDEIEVRAEGNDEQHAIVDIEKCLRQEA